MRRRLLNSPKGAAEKTCNESELMEKLAGAVTGLCILRHWDNKHGKRIEDKMLIPKSQPPPQIKRLNTIFSSRIKLPAAYAAAAADNV